jgi:DNA-binding transcriptional LysR family regulator
LLTEQAIVLEKALRLRIQVRSFEAVCRMVQVGMGVGVLPYEAAKVLAESMKLSVRPMNEPWAQRQVLVCVKKDRPAKPSLTLLINHLTA